MDGTEREMTVRMQQGDEEAFAWLFHRYQNRVDVYKRQYVEGYGVATIDEALILRRHGIQKPILVLGVTPQMRFDDLLNCNISPAIFQYEKAERLSKRARILGKKGTIHIAVDTGMSRIGLAPNEASADMVKKISRLPGIEITGVFTHFAKADEADKESASHQLALYSHFLDLLKERGVEIPLRHCANSAGIIDMDDSHFNMVRAGIITVSYTHLL